MRPTLPPSKGIGPINNVVEVVGPTDWAERDPMGKYVPLRATMVSTSRARFVLRIWLKPDTASTKLYHTEPIYIY